MGLFITLEGGEGSGKSTQCRILFERLQRTGHKVQLLQEPGSTPLGNYLRNWLKREEVTPVAELLLFEAARSELVQEVIRPQLNEGYTIVADRFSDSTLAYQGYGRGIDLDHVKAIDKIAVQGTVPDLTLLLDCPPEHGLDRGHSPHEGRRFENEALGFHNRVRQGYLIMASRDPGRWRIIDATMGIDKVAEAVWQEVQELLGR